MPQYKPVFECGEHDFLTEIYKEYQEHLASAAHKVTGSTICSDCGDKCDNDPEEEVVLQIGKTAPGRCPGCIKKEQDRVIERLRKSGQLDEVLTIAKEEKEDHTKK